jgi:ABC-2 type transport system permease protein
MARASWPLPTAQAFRDAIAEDKKAGFGHDETHPAFIAFRDRVLKRYGVSRVEDLPVSLRGLSLRESDEVGYRIFDRHFGRLQEQIDRQDRTRAAAGIVFPSLALQPISMAMAGTDNRHHHDFERAAETHRRQIQTAASQDLIDHARNGDANYEAPASLWQTIPPLHYEQPRASLAWRSQLGNFASLTLWSLFCCILAWRTAARPRVLSA